MTYILAIAKSSVIVEDDYFFPLIGKARGIKYVLSLVDPL